MEKSKEMMYDLNVDKNHNLFYNKTLIHNSDYRGELMIIIENTYKYPINITSRDRIAQGILARAPQAIFELIETLSITARGSGGFGSTGK